MEAFEQGGRDVVTAISAAHLYCTRMLHEDGKLDAAAEVGQ